MKMGDKVKYFRKLRNISQLQLELIINASSGMISRIESNHVNPTKETLFEISKALRLNKIEIAYLFGIIEFEYINNSELFN